MKECIRKYCTIVILILAFMLTGCDKSTTAEAMPASTEQNAAIDESILSEVDIPTKEADPAAISIESVEYTATDYSRTIEVKFRNISEIPVENITLYVDLVDENGDILGSDYLFFYSILDPGQAVTEAMWIDENMNPSSIRIARGDYYESNTDIFVEFVFEPYFISECSFNAEDKTTKEIANEEASNEELPHISTEIENEEFAFTAAEFVDCLYYMLPSDYAIASANYPGSDIVSTMILNENMDEQMQFLLFDIDGNYIDSFADDTTKVNCIAALHYFDTEYQEDDLSMEEIYYSAVSICDPSLDYDEFCEQLDRLKHSEGLSCISNKIVYSYEKSDSFDILYFRAVGS